MAMGTHARLSLHRMLVQAYMEVVAVPDTKPVVWIGNSKEELIAFPPEVVSAIGFAIYEAQVGNKHPSAKPLHGFAGAGVLEVVEDYDGDTFRTVYTVRLAGRVYVLHAFQKKSKHGIATPKAEIDLVKTRLRRALEQHSDWLKESEGNRRHG
jgi:phage-related protein